MVSFDEFTKEFVVPYLTYSKSVGELVESQSKGIEAAVKATRNFIKVVSASKKPSANNSALTDLQNTIVQPLQEVFSIKESKDALKSKFPNHLATVADGVSAFTWFAVDKPVSFISEFKDSAQFFANKVLKEFKGTDQTQVDWVQSFLKMITGLQAYVKQYHTTGPAWNNSGKDISEIVAALKSSSSSSPPPASTPKSAGPPAAGGPPPPPPPPPPPVADLLLESGGSAAPATGGMGAVFEQLNKGESVTAGLRKVDKSQMTHKNPDLRSTSTVPGSSSSSGSSHHKPTPPKKPAALLSQKKEAAAAKKPPRKALEDGKWFVENFENDSNIVVEAELTQSIFIDRCVNCTVQIKGKANALTINSCTGTGVLVDTLISGVDVIKCKKFGFQMTGHVATVSIDQSDSGHIYLSKASLDIEIYTSQTTALNIEVPKEEEGDFDEVAVPEQFLHKVGPNGKLVSSIVEHSG